MSHAAQIDNASVAQMHHGNLVFVRTHQPLLTVEKTVPTHSPYTQALHTVPIHSPYTQALHTGPTHSPYTLLYNHSGGAAVTTVVC